MDNIQNNEEIKQIDSKNLEKAIEAILFAAGHPVFFISTFMLLSIIDPPCYSVFLCLVKCIYCDQAL